MSQIYQVSDRSKVNLDFVDRKQKFLEQQYEVVQGKLQLIDTSVNSKYTDQINNLFYQKEFEKIFENSVGKHDGYIMVKQVPELRENIALTYSLGQKGFLDKDDIFLTSGQEQSYFLILSTLIKENKSFTISGFLEENLKQNLEILGADYVFEENVVNLNSKNTDYLWVNKYENLLKQLENLKNGKILFKLLVVDFSGWEINQVQNSLKEIYQNINEVPFIFIEDQSQKYLLPGIGLSVVGTYSQKGYLENVKKSFINIYCLIILPNSITLKAFEEIVKLDQNIIVQRQLQFKETINTFQICSKGQIKGFVLYIKKSILQDKFNRYLFQETFFNQENDYLKINLLISEEILQNL